MNIYKSIFPTLLVLGSSLANAQPLNNDQFAKQMIKYIDTSTLYWNQYIEASNKNENREILIEKLCRSKEAIYDVMFNANKYPHLPAAKHAFKHAKQIDWSLDNELNTLNSNQNECTKYMFNN